MAFTIYRALQNSRVTKTARPNNVRNDSGANYAATMTNQVKIESIIQSLSAILLPHFVMTDTARGTEHIQ